jgi:predicted outer membrane repeat protein
MSGAGAKNGSSWSNAYDSVGFRSALRTASSSKSFWVKKGTYTPANNRDSAFTVPSGVKLYGGFAGNETTLTTRDVKLNVTILSGDIGSTGTNADNSYNVVRFRDVSNTTTLDGFSIMHGNANYSAGNTNQNSGGGIYIFDDGTTSNSVCDPVIANCTFMYDSASTNGGAIYLNGLLHYFSNPTIVNCIFANNYAYEGAAIESDDGSPTITNCLFVNNASSYGCVYSEADHHNIVMVLDNCTFSNNSALMGAALYIRQDGIYTGNMTLNNCILWNDSATTSNNEIYYDGSTLTANYSDIKGGFSGTGNINLDPLFVSNTNFKLQTGSACTDAGNNSYIPSGINTDLDNLTRIQNSIVDMGAYEGGTCVILNSAAILPAKSIVCTGSKSSFTIADISYNASTQWQYTTDLSGVGTWTNFGTTNKDTASLNNITVNTMVKAVISNSCTSAFSSSSALVIISKPIVLTITNVTASAAKASWTAVSGALTYLLSRNGQNIYRGRDTSVNLNGISACPIDTFTVEPNTATCPGSDVNSNIVVLSTAYRPLGLEFITSGSNILANCHGGVGPFTLYLGYLDGTGKIYKYNLTDSSYTIASFKSGKTMFGYIIDQGSTCLLKMRSKTTYFNTPGGACATPAPVNVVHQLTTTSDSISWTGSASKYYIHYKGITDMQWHTQDSTTTNTYKLNAIEHSFCLIFYITTACGNAQGYSSAMDTVCTLAPCATPKNLILSTPTCQSFKATWDFVSGATLYVVHFNYPKNGETYYGSNSVRTNSYSLSYAYKLPGSTTVNVSVYAQGCNGGAAFSIPTTSQTITSLSVGCKNGFENGDIVETSIIPALNIYPNPNNGSFILDLSTSNPNDQANIQVTDIMGQVVFTNVISNSNGTIHSTINLNHQAAGIYFVKVIVGNEIFTSRIIVQI